MNHTSSPTGIVSQCWRWGRECVRVGRQIRRGSRACRHRRVDLLPFFSAAHDTAHSHSLSPSDDHNALRRPLLSPLSHPLFHNRTCTFFFFLGSSVRPSAVNDQIPAALATPTYPPLAVTPPSAALQVPASFSLVTPAQFRAQSAFICFKLYPGPARGDRRTVQRAHPVRVRLRERGLRAGWVYFVGEGGAETHA